MSQGTYLVIASIVAAGLLGGCGGATPGTSRTLGAVSYESAYAAGREVLSQHFSVLPSDPASGTLTCRPRAADARPGGLIGFTPTGRRKTATLRLLREGKKIVAHVAVTVEQQGRPVYRSMPQPGQEYSSVPNLTPAEEEAATTPEQNDAWRTVGRDRALEQVILNDLYRKLNAPAGT